MALVPFSGLLEWAGAEVGSHNREVFGELLEMSETEIEELAAGGVI